MCETLRAGEGGAPIYIYRPTILKEKNCQLEQGRHELKHSKDLARSKLAVVYRECGGG